MRKISKTISLLILFSCFFFYMNDFRDVGYDSEPDYIANGFHILNTSKPLGAHHPGTLNYYFVSLNLLVTEALGFSPDQSIYFVRGVYFLLLILILLITKTKTHLFLFIVVLSELSYLKNVNFIISAEILLVPLSILLYYLIEKKSKHIYIALLFGAMINIKLTAVLLFPFILTLISFKNKDLFKFMAFSILFFVFLSLPSYGSVFQVVKPVYNILLQSTLIETLETIIGFDIKINFFWSSLLGLLTAIITIAIIKVIHIYRGEFQTEKTKSFIFYSYIFFIVLFFQNENLRHFSATLPFIILGFKKIIFNNKTIKTSIYIIYLILLTNKLYGFSPRENNSIDEYIKNTNQKVYLLQESNFNSETEFIKWSDYRYGNSKQIIPDSWTNLSKKAEYLNTRFYLLYNNEQRESLSLNYKEILDKNSTNSYTNNITKQLQEVLQRQAVILINLDMNKTFIEEFRAVKKEINQTYELIELERTSDYIVYLLE